MMVVKIQDMQKLESPFVREDINGEYIVTPVIQKGYEWVFEDETVLATEKLHGTNVSIIIENGEIISIWNRTQRIPFFCKGKTFIVEGVIESFKRGYTDLSDGQWFGELIGERINGNPYEIKSHLWLPFETYVRKHLAYKSWGKYPKTFEKDLFSLLMRKKAGIVVPAEGVVFVQPHTGKMAKLRRDMFSWYKGVRHKN